MRRQKLFAQVKSNVLALDPQARVFLYGSRARGDHKRLSDWDFFVMTSYPFDWKKVDELRDLLYDVELESGQLISSVVESKEGFERLKAMPLYQNIVAEGVEI
ncbi:MAG: nucleotidyltransferase domain-containing protein [Saprospiraceae bacterium]